MGVLPVTSRLLPLMAKKTGTYCVSRKEPLSSALDLLIYCKEQDVEEHPDFQLPTFLKTGPVISVMVL